jgi:superfamily II RNA helicase
MTTLQLENYTEDEILLILRDLSVSEKLNVQELFKQYLSNTNNSFVSSRQDVIRKNIVNSEVKLKKRDKERLKYFDNLSKFRKSLFDELPNFETEYGKKKFKIKLLKLAFSERLDKHIINLYLQILSTEYNKNTSKTMKKVSKFMDNIDYKKLQFEQLYNDLYPLDFYNEHPKVLDKWQIKVIEHVNRNESVLITAPTSCGKTWLAIYPGVIGKKVLFIVPTDALVFQVGSLFNKFTKSSPLLITDEGLYGNNKDIVVGTPKKIEDKLPIIGNDFDYIIVDEIHNLNSEELHHYYERLLKIFSDKSIMGLSATIGDPQSLISWLNSFSEKEINLVSFNTRFLNLQRKVFHNNKLVNIHPMSCLTLDDINTKYLSKNLPMTPPDCVALYNSLSNKFKDEMENLSVAKFYPEDNRRLSLEDSRVYESALKNKLIELKDKYPDAVEEVIEEYRVETDMGDVNLYNLFCEIKSKSLIPCIVFQDNTGYCREIFTKLVGYLEKLETLNYPYHYENVEFRLKCYKKFRTDLVKYRSTIKVDKDVYNARDFIDELVEKYTEEQTNTFVTKFKTRIEKQISQIGKSSHNDRIKRTQVLNLKNEFDKFLRNPSLSFVDIFKKHEDFCLNADSPMSADKIRTIKRTIQSKMQINVSYTNVFMQGLKRGLGIYTKHMPSVYNMIVQRYAQNGELGFVVADDRLALGINMPFRSTCILGYSDSIKYDTHKYLQMIGRAGRRGKDDEGTVIYGNVDWKSLMKSELSDIISPYVHIKNYNVLSQFTDDFNSNIPKIYDYKMNSNSVDETHNTEFFKHPNLNIILWKLREYNEKSIEFCKGLFQFNIDMRINKNDSSIKKIIEYFCTHLLDDEYKAVIINILHKRKIENSSYLDYVVIKEFLRILMEVHNTLIVSTEEDLKLNELVSHINYSFTVLKQIVLNSNDLN